MLRYLLRLLPALLCLSLLPPAAHAQKRKIQNRPYIDQRRFHYGFSVGLNLQDYELENTNFVTEDGELWYADVASYTPGFSVGVLGELYLNKYLALRLLPTLHFGSKDIVFRNYNAPDEAEQTERQQVKSTYISLPLDLKFSAPRFNNYRPYMMVGVNPMYDLSTKKGERLRFKPMNLFLDTESNGMKPEQVCQLAVLAENAGVLTGYNWFWPVSCMNPYALKKHGFSRRKLLQPLRTLHGLYRTDNNPEPAAHTGLIRLFRRAAQSG